MSIAKITGLKLRHYRDNDSRLLYVEFIDHRGKASRVESDAESATKSAHMQALVARANRESVKLQHETW